MTLLEIGLGALLGACFVLLARMGREDRLLGLGLVIAALIYLGFGLINGAGGGEILVEIGGVIVFTGVAVAGVLVSPWWLSLGWAAHVIWDVAVHPPGTDLWVPEFYGPLCIGFDLAVAFYVAVRVVNARTA